MKAVLFAFAVVFASLHFAAAQGAPGADGSANLESKGIVVPEPSSSSLACIGVLAWFVSRRRG
jgi:hypothetical protein